MIEIQHPELSIRRQSRLLGVNRNRIQSRPTRTSEEDEEIMRRLDELHTKWPFLGQRRLVEELRDQGIVIGRNRIRRLMKIMGIEAIAPKPPLSVPAPLSEPDRNSLIRTRKDWQQKETTSLGDGASY